jgi:rRNA maturation RNase YbeY
LGLADPELSILLTDDPHIQALNAQWREEDKTTDVLSFPLYEAHEIHATIPALGDVVINIDYAERLVAGESHRFRVAESLGVDPQTLTWGLLHEVDFLLIHGLLHLVGHDHAEPEEEAVMRAEERRLWGVGPN